MQLGTHHQSQNPDLTPDFGRTIAEWDPAGRSLIIDTTSFLVASHFGFLDLLENAFRPIGVCTALISSLHLMRDQLHAETPQSIEPFNRILQFVARGAIQSSTGSRQSPTDLTTFTLDDLFLHSAGHPTAGTIRLPHPGDTVGCTAATLVALERHHLLEFAASVFTLVLHESELEYIRAEVEAESARQLLASWFDERIDRIYRGLASSAYALQPFALPASPPPSGAAYLHSVVEPCDGKTALMWVPGRYSESPYNSAQTPIINIFEVLADLRRAGHVTEDQLHEIMFRMRDANVLCLPITAGELLRHLRQAGLQAGALVEDRHLLTLRRNIALSLECSADPSRHDIACEYAASLLRVVEEAIVQCWAECDDSHRAAAIRTEWLLESIYWDALAVLPPEQKTPRIAAGFVSMIVGAYSLWPVGGQAESLRQCRLDWLKARLMAIPPPLRDQILQDPSLQDGLGLSDHRASLSMDPAH